jgi:hypothetical protein
MTFGTINLVNLGDVLLFKSLLSTTLLLNVCARVSETLTYKALYNRALGYHSNPRYSLFVTQLI